MEFFKTLKEIDFFGKEPEFYIEGKSKQITFIGRIFTLIFIIIYIIFFSYKLYRMFQRVDITFYDSSSNTDGIFSYNFTDENFFLVFAVTDENDEPFINESIYYPEAHFYHIEEDGRKNEKMKIERCDRNKMGSKYQNYFLDSEISNYYCLRNINHSMRPYMTSFFIELFPCKNTSENNYHCKSKEIIDKYLNGNIFITYFPDIVLTPLNYNMPIKEKISSQDTLIYKNVGQYLFNEMHLIRIETYTNIFGFDFLSQPKIEEFIKFDNCEHIPNPGYNLDDETNNNSICMFEYVLDDKIIIEKRQYIQFIDVLGEVGGFMEIIRSFLSLICSLIVDILYQNNITNNLFSYNLKKKFILLKKIKIEKNEDKKIYKSNNENILSYTMRKNNNKLRDFITENNDDYIKDKNSENHFIHSLIIENNDKNNDFHSLKRNLKDQNKSSIIEYTHDKILKMQNENDYKDVNIIDKINIKDILFSLCHCRSKKKKNLYKILLYEGMNVIIDKLDIYNIFRNINLIEHINYNNNSDYSRIKMSEECIKNLPYILS